MKKIFFLFIIICGCSTSKNNHEGHKSHSNKNTNSSEILSPQSVAMAMVGGAHIHIDYSSPSVRDRIIFGGLLAYNQVWQSGAHNATWIETDYDLNINGNKLDKGRYGFFTIPKKDTWTIIFNKNWKQHGKDDYDENEDVFRFEVTPTILPEIVESLRYEVKKVNERRGSISLAWEKIKISFTFDVIKE